MARQLTITLDDETAERLEAEARRREQALDEFASQFLRNGAERLEGFELRGPFATSRPGAGSFDCIARVLDEVEGPEWK